MRPAVTAALTKALFVEWARVGYGALSLEAVAKRAGVGKTALYRRWPSKLAMVTDRLLQVRLADARLPKTTDTGSFEGDVKLFLRHFRRLLRRPLVRRLLPDIVAEMARSAEFASAIRLRLNLEFKGATASLLRRAVMRGEIATPVDLQVATDALMGILYWRLVGVGEQTSDEYLDHLATFMVAGFTHRSG